MTPSGDFVPAWWLPGPHMQTVGALLLRPKGGVATRRQRLELADGDFVDLDWVEGAAGLRPDPTGPLVLILHGLEGSSASTYVLEMHRALAREGVDSVAMNFRSCGGEPNRLPRFYHSGDTDDLSLVLTVLGRRYPKRRLGLVGFSLGANVAIKYLGELGHRSSVAAAAAVSVPFDLDAGLTKLERGAGRAYQRYLMDKLHRKVRLKARSLNGQVDIQALLAATTIRQFDELATAPLHGFRDAADYYSKSSSGRFLDGVGVPLLIVHAEDDPFYPADAVPHREIADHQWIEADITRCGGHVAFVAGRRPFAPKFWAEQRAAAFLAGCLRD